MNQLFFPRIISEFNIYFANSIWIDLQSTIPLAESRWIYYPFHFITVNTLTASRFYYVFTICSANSPWIHYPFLGITLNLLSFSLHHCENTIYFAISLWIHYIFWESRIVKSDIFLRTQFESPLFIANLLRIMTHKWRYAYVTDRIITLHTEIITLSFRHSRSESYGISQ